MSQQKVEKYKEYKKNKKVILAKEKRNKKLASVAFVGVLTAFVLCIVLVFGSVIFDSVKRYQASIPKYDYVATDRVVGDMVGVLETEEETEEVPETTQKAE